MKIYRKQSFFLHLEYQMSFLWLFLNQIKFEEGTLLELNEYADEKAKVLIDGKVVADESFGIRIREVLEK